ncbi:hypothetical protein ILYODFUR_016723 [Ilyodon furcidens]|uniref:Uncharacterized protein n=1 Tax=Ilyodon furcidens TaxID=33524 RepID=A0ABV0V6G8_9TELE
MHPYRQHPAEADSPLLGPHHAVRDPAKLCQFGRVSAKLWWEKREFNHLVLLHCRTGRESIQAVNILTEPGGTAQKGIFCVCEAQQESPMGSRDGQGQAIYAPPEGLMCVPYDLSFHQHKRFLFASQLSIKAPKKIKPLLMIQKTITFSWQQMP